MTVNVFEGTRRIARLIAVLIVVGFVIVIFTDSEKPVPVHYLIAAKDKPPVRVEECPDRVSEEFKRVTSKRGRSVDVTLCFNYPEATPSTKFDISTARPVDWDAFLEKSGGLSMDYISRVRDSFQIPEADEDHIIRLGWTQMLKNAGLYFLGMLASLAFLWAFTWAVGWVVRGFLGIPRGHDRRPDAQ